MITDRGLALLIAERLLLAYNRHPAEIARVLDEEIDRSGNMLGWLRRYKEARAAQPAAPVTSDKQHAADCPCPVSLVSGGAGQ